MSHRVRCPYCAGAEGGRCASLGSGRFVTECASCGRVVEERAAQVEELFAERAQDTPLCIVTPDFSDAECGRPPPPPMEEDPFESTGFITAFSIWSLERAPLFAATTTSFCGYLAELERVLLDSPSAACSSSSSSSSAAAAEGSITNTAAAAAATTTTNNVSLVDNLRAYLQIVDVASILGLDRDISDHAIQLFRDCSSTTYLRNRNIEALATAALLQAIREAQEPRTLQEISAAANVQQKEIGKYLKILGDALKLSQPLNSNSISVHMPRFCSLLQLSKTTQDLATHIGEVVINKCFCTRRNPISISAAAIYLACQLEDKRKTQAEICKATGLTEVTLRKVYKELLENWDDLLPNNYTPVVPPEKAFPMTAAALGRASTTKGDVNGGALSVTSALDSSATATSAFSNTTFLPDSTLGMGSVSCNSSTSQSFGQVSGSCTPEYITASHFRASTPSSDGKGTGHIFVLQSVAKEGNMDSEKRLGKSPEDSDRDYIQDTENKRELIDSGLNSGGVNFMSQFSAGMPSFRPSFLPFGDPRVYPEINPTLWQPQLLYGVPAFRPAEDKGGNSNNRKNEEPLHTATKGYSFLLPNLGDKPTFTSSRPDLHQTIGNAPNNLSDSDQKNDIQRDKERVHSKGVGCEREGNAAGNQILPQFLRGSPIAPFSTFGAGASGVGSTATQSFPSNVLSFLNPLGSGSLSMLPPQMLSNYGALWQGLSSSTEMHGGPDKGNLSVRGDKFSHGTAPSIAIGEALSRLASTNIGTGMSMAPPKVSQLNASQSSHSVWLHPSHQLSFTAVNGVSSGDGPVALRRDVIEGNVIPNSGRPRLSEGANLSWPSSDGQNINAGINLSFGPNHTAD